MPRVDCWWRCDLRHDAASLTDKEPALLAFKLLIVPIFIVLITLAARRWGPQVAGVMAGFPLVTGPILFFIDLEQEYAFAAMAAVSSVSAVTAAVAFGFAYAWTSRFRAWWSSLPVALGAWAATAFTMAQLQPSLLTAATITLTALWLAPSALPAVAEVDAGKPTSPAELLARMLAGALLVATVTTAAASLGSRWSGLLAMFPVLASVLCVFSHRSHGPAYVAHLLRGMVKGYYSFTAFCVTLALLLPQTGTATAFVAGLSAAFALQFCLQGIHRIVGYRTIRAAREAA